MTTSNIESARIVIVGGGSAGITIAAMLKRRGAENITLLEPAETHYYQPYWTLVGGGCVTRADSARPMAKLIPKGTRWVRDRATAIDPEAKRVDTASSGAIEYDYLIVAAGLQLDWDAIEGIREALETPTVSSNYDGKLAEKTWRNLKSFEGGTALFTCPRSPIKCAGAPQKIVYLAAHHFMRSGIRDKCQIVFASSLPSLFGIPEFAKVLGEVASRYEVDTRFHHDLIRVDGEAREAIFSVGDADSVKREERIHYDFLHVVPPQSAPDFIKKSPLAEDSAKGWVSVDKETLRHTRYPEVFALGDVSNTPNAKTGAAVRYQAPVVVANLLDVMAGREPTARYGGYGACPVTTAYGRVLMAEFDYSGHPAPSFRPLDTMKERYDMWLLKRYGIPFLYWHGMLRGIVAPPWSRP